ncbi:MAG: hypothetical protein WC261_05435 [Synergistaceae bacterium]|jgi:hypothetical protein
MTEKISWDANDDEKDTAKKQILIEKPTVERTSLTRIDEEIKMVDGEIQWATSRKADLVAKRARITSSLSIVTKE